MPQTFYTPEEWIQRRIRILLLGAGGTGGEVLYALARMHMLFRAIGCGERLHVTLMDGDTVSASNIGRQRFAPCDIGFSKAQVLTQRLNLFFSLDWRAVHTDWTPGCPEPRLQRFDLLISCVDRAKTRVALARAGAAFDPPLLWLDFGNGQFTGQCVLGHLGKRADDGRLHLANVFDLYPELPNLDDADTPSCSAAESVRSQDLFTNALLAESGVSLLWKLLRHGSTQTHGTQIDVREPSVEPLWIDPAAWAFYAAARAKTATNARSNTMPTRSAA